MVIKLELLITKMFERHVKKKLDLSKNVGFMVQKNFFIYNCYYYNNLIYSPMFHNDPLKKNQLPQQEISKTGI